MVGNSALVAYEFSTNRDSRRSGGSRSLLARRGTVERNYDANMDPCAAITSPALTYTTGPGPMRNRDLSGTRPPKFFNFG